MKRTLWIIVLVVVMLVVPGVILWVWGQDSAYRVSQTYNGEGHPVYEIVGSSDTLGIFQAQGTALDMAWALNHAHQDRLDEEEYRRKP